MLYATIMAGGSGTRFWPASRQSFPKQLLALTGERTMLQATVDRLSHVCPAERVFVLTNERLVPATVEQLPELPPQQIIGEPCKRDTAPCIGFAASLIAAQDPEGIMLVTPADQVIQTSKQFQQAIDVALKLVEEDENRLVTFGIKPTYPATVFGYIERASKVGDHPISAFQVARFREKPDIKTAQAFLEAGNFYWNGGIFVWKARTILNALREFEPQMFQRIEVIAQAIGTPQFPDVFRDEFQQIKGKSIDFAVMEHYPHIFVVEAPFTWDDVGNWSSLPRLTSQDAAGNTVIGPSVLVDTSDCIVRSSPGHLVATLGLKNCIVVHTPDATLVADRADEEAVRKIVAKLEELGLHDYL
ncbi:MAG TPA: mannose-1-phosphate guanylyltransferase [Pirellulaceae bacterium]|nr:mannose-1-phosphate guanylyltransferase [Pirellulaceae bacterium]HMO92941.1 mannose-1-phosphate guanylyltransferase [Pirellulaceae bacterium]HMP68494.1 mannose-1-phosphate guanylyltransferase [Pirellulaceae bacterium]